MTRRGLFARLVAVLAAAVGVRKVVNWHPEVVASDPQLGISIRLIKEWPEWADDVPFKWRRFDTVVMDGVFARNPVTDEETKMLQLFVVMQDVDSRTGRDLVTLWPRNIKVRADALRWPSNGRWWKVDHHADLTGDRW